ncbi:PIN domain-containing protein [Zoogloea sp. LCSB751]|uniref:PIN domain-containing protein n=1 Tax=Zoogloea sp. LCSB751 TaxID=1965277 RepID=UPI0009A4F99A|nr:PIN domain-containing protein [Zoogloea sp. LCSB751]
MSASDEGIGRPWIFILDTCVLLDIVRAPVRREFSTENARALVDVANGVRTGAQDIRIVIPSLVREEFELNFPKVQSDAVQELSRTLSNLAHAHQTLDILSARTPSPSTLDAAQWIAGCESFARDLIDTAQELPTSDEDVRRAGRRSLKAVAPAKRGKSSLPDCVITEFALRIARENVQNASPSSVLFISSNDADYCDGRRLIASLQTEFDAAGLDFCRNWAESRGSIMRR